MKAVESNKGEGKIGYYNLQDWWLSTFTVSEREYIDERYQSMGAQPHSLTQGKIKWISRGNGVDIDAGFFLYTLATYFRKKTDLSIYERIQEKVDELGRSRPLSGVGYLRGRYYITFVHDVTILKRQGKLDEAETLLLELINADEACRRVEKRNPAPWYYEELAIVYRKNKKYSQEISVIERYLNQSDGGGVNHLKMVKRLEKAKLLLNKAKNTQDT